MNSGLRILASVALASAVASVSYAQETSSNKVAEKTDWAVFVENDPKECWAVSVPKETVNTRQGRVVSVRRGEILFFVTYNPASGVNGQVSFTGSCTVKSVHRKIRHPQNRLELLPSTVLGKSTVQPPIYLVKEKT